MNEKNVTTDDFIKIGEDAAHCAYEFLNTTIIKENPQGLNSLIEDLKIKYANANN